MKLRDVVLAALIVLIIWVVGKTVEYSKYANDMNPKQPSYIVHKDYGRTALERKAAQEKQGNRDEVDWSWLRKGARKYKDDGTLLPGGPVQVKPTKIPVVYGDPSVGEKTLRVPASEANSVDARDLRDQAWDRAFEMSEVMSEDNY
jgi:hypothetical protein